MNKNLPNCGDEYAYTYPVDDIVNKHELQNVSVLDLWDNTDLFNQIMIQQPLQKEGKFTIKNSELYLRNIKRYSLC